MDEPLSNLDAKLRVHMRAELKRLQKEIGVTTVYVTHDQVEVMTMADQIAIMNQGVLQQLGNAYEVFHNPKSLFVAGFTGSPPMNFLDCTLAEKEGSYVLDAGSFVFPVTERTARLIKENTTKSELILGVRPEDVLLSRRRTAREFIKAEVYVTEPMGAELIVDLKVADAIAKSKTSPTSIST